MTNPIRVACVQVTSSSIMEENLTDAGTLIRAAHDAGAILITTPENVSRIVSAYHSPQDYALAESDHPALAYFRSLARELRIWLLIGSLWIKRTEGGQTNRSYLLDRNGEIMATYDKVHLFDVSLPNGEIHRESAIHHPGNRLVVTPPAPWGRLGMSICYDLRFAYLYRSLAHAGATILCVPSAFTVPTGQAHWHILLRARAIETGCYVLAPAQCGLHDQGRRTYGHSLIIGPWGDILAEAQDHPGFITADIDPDLVGKIRGMIPSLLHDRSDLTLETPTQSSAPMIDEEVVPAPLL